MTKTTSLGSGDITIAFADENQSCLMLYVVISKSTYYLQLYDHRYDYFTCEDDRVIWQVNDD